MFLAPIIHYVSDTNYVDVGCYIYTCELQTKRNPNLPKITIGYMTNSTFICNYFRGGKTQYMRKKETH